MQLESIKEASKRDAKTKDFQPKYDSENEDT